MFIRALFHGCVHLYEDISLTPVVIHKAEYSRTPRIRPPSESHWCGRIRGMVAREGGRSSGVLLYYPLRWGSLPKYVHVNGSGKLHLYTEFGNIVGTPNIVSRYCLQSVATVIEFCYIRII